MTERAARAMSPSFRPATGGVTLDVLCRNLGVRPARPEPVVTTVTGVTQDSRDVRPGDLYLALPGRRVHGAVFDAEAAARWAVAMVSDRPSAHLPTITVTDPR